MLPYDKCKQVYGVCFYGNKIVVGFSRKMKKWSLIGGTIEPGELFTQTLRREVQEESNMKVIKSWPIGYQKVVEEDIYQLRYACVVEPYGEFISDPDATENNGVDKIKLVGINEFISYVKWGQIGEQMLKRSIEKLKIHI